MNYNEALEYIENTAKFGMNLGLDRVMKLLECMGNPHKNLRCIHVAGTNGKGSVTSMISSIIEEVGYKVGMYTSPHLQRFTERIKINDKEISEEDTVRLITEITPFIDRVEAEGYGHPTEFEIITALMFKYFDESKTDFCVIEVGLGGRLDATNVMDPLVSVITTISYDHMNVLGNTLESIAHEKAGIIKEGGVVVTYPQDIEALKVIRDTCSEKGAVLLEVEEGGIIIKDYSPLGQTFDLYLGRELYKDIRINLIGEHQLLNAKTAVAAVRALSTRGIEIDSESICAGLKKARWPGRLEVIHQKPFIVLDGAHNLQGIESLKSALKKYFKYGSLILVMGVLKDKQVEEMCASLIPMAHRVITTLPVSERAMSPQELAKIASRYCSDVIDCTDMEEALKCGLNGTKEDDLLVFCGSLYMIGHIRTLAQNYGILVSSM